MVGIILVFLFQNKLEEQFHFKAKFQFDWLFDQVEHVPRGGGALISRKHTLIEQQENKELICESVIRPWRAKARPRELRSSGVSTSYLYRNRETLSKESIMPFRKAEFKIQLLFRLWGKTSVRWLWLTGLYPPRTFICWQMTSFFHCGI